MDQIIANAERLGVIGSPSSTSQLTIDILGTAADRKLVGELVLFRYLQDGNEHCALGQITEVSLRNIWHEDPTMRSLIRQRGRVEAVSERQDTHIAQMTVSAVFQKREENGYEPSLLGTVPATGTSICKATDNILEGLLQVYQQQIFYLGHVYGSQPKLPLWFKHFDIGPDGAGEAYHIGIFGKTGSGKSVLAKMILLAYARHPKMALLVIDPQGEFARDARTGPPPGEFPLHLGNVIKNNCKKPIVVISINNLVLDRWELFKQILFESLFFERLTIPRGENRELACSILTERLERSEVKLANLWTREAFDKAWRIISDDNVQKIFYRSESSRSRFKLALTYSNQDEFYQEFWRPVAELFRSDRPQARTIDKALSWLLNPDQSEQGIRPILIIDLSKENVQGLLWNDMIQSMVIKRLLDGLTVTAESFYKQSKNLNTLVIIDEAHRLAPRYTTNEDETVKSVCAKLVDAARTTRKYGLGWLFISQTLHSLHSEIIGQMRIFFFGFGLGLGQEFRALQQLVGSSGTALNLYQLFRDPHSSFDLKSRQYSFMTIGPVSPLSFSGSPLFFNAFNNVNEFLEANHFKLIKPV